MTRTFSEFKEAVKKDGAKIMASDITDTKALADSISLEMKSAGRLEVEYDIQKNMEHKAAMLETKANEIMHTANTGFGAELIPGNILMTDFLDLIPSASPLMSFFQAGYHGKNLALKQDVGVLGELPLHVLKSEQTGNPLAFAQGLGKQPTKKIEIVQKQRFFSVDISEYEQQFAVLDVVALVKRKLAQSAANTQASDILNGDIVTAATGNVNSVDAAPAGNESFLAADGLVKKAFSEATTFDAGTLAFDDYLSPLNALGYNGADKENLIYIHSTRAETAGLAVPDFRQAYINGQLSTALTGKLPKFLGASIHTDRLLKEANATGKVSVTPANNSKGRCAVAHKMAVQWGTNGDYYMEIYRVPGSGYQVIGWYFSGHAIAGTAEVGTPLTALLYNIS